MTPVLISPYSAEMVTQKNAHTAMAYSAPSGWVKAPNMQIAMTRAWRERTRMRSGNVSMRNHSTVET